MPFAAYVTILALVVAVAGYCVWSRREVSSVLVMVPPTLVVLFPEFGRMNVVALAISAGFLVTNYVRFFPWRGGTLRGMAAEFIVTAFLLGAMLHVDLFVPDRDPSQPAVLKTLGVLLGISVIVSIAKATWMVLRVLRNRRSQVA